MISVYVETEQNFEQTAGAFICFLITSLCLFTAFFWIQEKSPPAFLDSLKGDFVPHHGVYFVIIVVFRSNVPAQIIMLPNF